MAILLCINGSPEARFETDEERSYFLTTLPIHPSLESREVSASTQSVGESTQSGEEIREFPLFICPSSLQKKLAAPTFLAKKSNLRQVIIELCSEVF